MRTYKFTFIIIPLLLSILTCSWTASQPAVANSSADGSATPPEIQLAIRHFQKDPNPLKQQALEFLLDNMDGHSYVSVELYDSLKQIIPFCVTDYANYGTMVAGWDSIEVETGELHFARCVTQEDWETITADFLIENIDWAFKAWNELPWASALTFAEFTNYVLPYRGSNEPLNSFRPLFWNRYHTMLIDSSVGNDPIRAAALINQELKSWFRFDERYYRHPTDQGVKEMLEMKLGRCEDMTNLAIAAMRANGIAVTSDYTPYWANSGNNHAWNAVLAADKRIVPFMGCESDPGEYRLWNKLAKVYRKMYAEQPTNLAFVKQEWEEVPRWLAGKSYLDVTSDYVDVSDVTLTLDSIPDSTHFAYLCVFNSGEWGTIHWGKINDSQVTFSDMGRDIVYLPAYFLDQTIVPAAPPFILDEAGNMIQLISDETAPDLDMFLISTTKRSLAISTDGIAETFFTEGAEYELFLWQNAWTSLGKAVAQGSALSFTAPQGGLYWLVESGGRQQERIFTWKDGQQVWW